MKRDRPYGCLALLFGIGATRHPNDAKLRAAQRRRAQLADEMDDNMEGDIHSGPGGYEGMGYAGGYAADYRARQHHEHDADLSDHEFDENEGEY